MKAASGIKVCPRTIQRHLKRAGHVKRLPRKTPDIIPRHEQLRITFCKEWRHSSFSNVFIPDDCRFRLHSNTIKVWTRKKCETSKEVPKFFSRCDGALWNHGFYLTFEAGILDSEKYCSILDNFIPYANGRFRYGWVLQQDGARPRTTRYTRNWFSSKWIDVL